jgi:putative transposase
LHRWRSKYGGMQSSDVRKLKTLEDENASLKRLLAEAQLDIAALKTVVAKKYEPR